MKNVVNIINKVTLSCMLIDILVVYIDNMGILNNCKNRMIRTVLKSELIKDIKFIIFKDTSENMFKDSCMRLFKNKDINIEIDDLNNFSNIWKFVNRIKKYSEYIPTVLIRTYNYLDNKVTNEDMKSYYDELLTSFVRVIDIITHYRNYKDDEFISENMLIKKIDSILGNK